MVLVRMRDTFLHILGLVLSLVVRVGAIHCQNPSMPDDFADLSRSRAGIGYF